MGLNHISGQFSTSNFGSFYSYKYNGKELQETGMYDYGARMLMPDLGRWGVMDAMSEKYARWSPYNYAINNPVMVIDPDGNDIQSPAVEAAQRAFRAYVSTMSFSTGTSGGSGFTGLNAKPFEKYDWVKGLDGKWRYEAGITTLEKAQRMAGITGFAKNGTIFSNVSVDGGSISAYARLNEGGSITKLGADDLASMNAIVDMLPMFLGGSWTTWTNETFQIFTGGANETDPETMKKVLPGDKLETNNMFEYIFGGYGRNTRLNRKNMGDAAIQFGLDIEGIGNPFNFKSNDSTALVEQISDSPFSYSRDTIKKILLKRKPMIVLCLIMLLKMLMIKS